MLMRETAPRRKVRPFFDFRSSGSADAGAPQFGAMTVGALFDSGKPANASRRRSAGRPSMSSAAMFIGSSVRPGSFTLRIAYKVEMETRIHRQLPASATNGAATASSRRSRLRASPIRTWRRSAPPAFSLQTLSTDFLGPADRQAHGRRLRGAKRTRRTTTARSYDYLVALQVDAKRRRRPTFHRLCRVMALSAAHWSVAVVPIQACLRIAAARCAGCFQGDRCRTLPGDIQGRWPDTVRGRELQSPACDRALQDDDDRPRSFRPQPQGRRRTDRDDADHRSRPRRSPTEAMPPNT